MTEESYSQADIAWEITNQIQSKQPNTYPKEHVFSLLPDLLPTIAKNLLSLCRNMQATILLRLTFEARMP